MAYNESRSGDACTRHGVLCSRGIARRLLNVTKPLREDVLALWHTLLEHNVSFSAQGHGMRERRQQLREVVAGLETAGKKLAADAGLVVSQSIHPGALATASRPAIEISRPGWWQKSSLFQKPATQEETAWAAASRASAARSRTHVALVLYGAVRSDAQFALSEASIRFFVRDLLDLVVQRRQGNVSTHASIDCIEATGCTLPGVRAMLAHPNVDPKSTAMAMRALQPATLHLEAAPTEKLTPPQAYRRALTHALRALGHARMAGAHFVIVSRLDVEYHASIHLEKEGWTAPQNQYTIWVPQGYHFEGFNDRWCAGGFDVVMEFFEIRFHLLNETGNFAEGGACEAATAMRDWGGVAVRTVVVRMVRRRAYLDVPDIDKAFSLMTIPPRDWFFSGTLGCNISGTLKRKPVQRPILRFNQSAVTAAMAAKPRPPPGNYPRAGRRRNTSTHLGSIAKPVPAGFHPVGTTTFKSPANLAWSEVKWRGRLMSSETFAALRARGHRGGL